MTRILGFVVLIVCSMASTSVVAQRGLDDQAEKYFKAGKYAEAYEIYDRIDLDREDLMRKGIAAYHSGKYSESLRDLIDCYSRGHRNKLLYKYVGDNYRAKGEYVQAAKFYKSYLSELDDDSPERNITIHKIKRCGYARDYKYADQIAFVENLGETVNTAYDELAPLQSPGNKNKYYLSSNRSTATGGMRAKDGTKDDVYGSYSADMYAVETINGVWTAVSGIDPILNSAKNDVLQDFGPEGKILYFLRTSDFTSGELLTDTFRIAREEIVWPQAMNCPIVASLGDRDLRVFNANTYLFSSKRKGGYGGYDIYMVNLSEDGVWGEPINLGPEVNSAFDEITPYLTINGSKLYFSSNRLNSMGGFDVYMSDFGLETKKWNAPTNLGVPVNSPQDDIYFRLNSDAITGVLSSDRMGSLGGFDLYNVYFKTEVPEQQMASAEVPFLVMKAMENLPVAESEEVVVDGGQTPSDSVREETEPVTEAKVKSDVESKYEGMAQREVSIGPLYYQSSENILNPQNVKQLAKIVETMKIFPETRVELTGHAVQEGMPEFDLYFSIKRAEKVADYLASQGVDRSRVELRGVGIAYPAADPNNYVQSNKYNRRIDVRMLVPNEVPLLVLATRNPIPVQVRDEAVKDLRRFENGLKYKLHIAKTQQMYKDPIIKQSPNVMIEKSASANSYQYTIGVYDSYNQARSARLRLSNRPDYTQISIQPYVKGEMLPASEIESSLAKYPDLGTYIRYERGE